MANNKTSPKGYLRESDFIQALLSIIFNKETKVYGKDVFNVNNSDSQTIRFKKDGRQHIIKHTSRRMIGVFYEDKNGHHKPIMQNPVTFTKELAEEYVETVTQAYNENKKKEISENKPTPSLQIIEQKAR